MTDSIINFIYKYITKLFLMISEFLNDDYINSPLLVEAKWYRKNSDSLDNRYPYQNAHKMLKMIANLGKVDGSGYLDKFRKVVTMLGNVLGFVRMIKTASITDSTSTLKFVSNDAIKMEFEE